MRSKIVASVMAAFVSLLSVSAFAGDAKRATFPMPAAEFKTKVDSKIAKAKTKIEGRASKLNPEEAKQLRARFDAGVVKVNAEVAKATADGTVTKDEAKDVRKAAREIGGGHAARGKKRPKK